MRFLSTSLALLLTASVCFGQAFTLRRPFVYTLASQSTPAAIPGLAYWWVASDLTNSFTVGQQVNNWTDRVTGISLVGTTNLPYLGDTNYLQFNKSNWLALFPPIRVLVGTNNFGQPLTNDSVAVIGWHAQNANVGDFLDTTNGAAVVFQIFATLDTRFAGVSVGNIASNHVFDFLACNSTNGGPLNYNCYTNGQFMKSQNVGNTDAIGVVGGSKDRLATAALRGRIYEILIWTNRGVYWTDAEIAAVHKYATNTYNFSP